MLGNVGGVLKYCHIGGFYNTCHACKTAPLCTAVCTPRSLFSFQHRHSKSPWIHVVCGTCGDRYGR